MNSGMFCAQGSYKFLHDEEKIEKFFPSFLQVPSTKTHEIQNQLFMPHTDDLTPPLLIF